MQKNYFKYSIFLVFIQFWWINGQNMSLVYDFTFKIEGDKVETQKYFLDITPEKSIFRTARRKKSDSLLNTTGKGLAIYTKSVFDLYLTKEMSSNIFKKQIVIPIGRDKFFIEINEKLDWKIKNETASIEGIKCQKAEVKYAGRDWVAWFTSDFPIPEGPYYFHGLPGLIVQINDINDEFIFKLSEIKKNNMHSLYETGDGKEISITQYKQIMINFFNNPFSAIKARGENAYMDDGNGGYKPMDYLWFTKQLQKTLIKYNNVIELNQNIKFE